MKAIFEAIRLAWEVMRQSRRYENCPHPDEEAGCVSTDMRDTRTIAHRIHDAIFGPPNCTGVFRACPRCFRRIIPILAVVLFAGEWVTSEKTGARICRAAYTIVTEMQLSRSMCTDWQIPVPAYGESIDQYRDWIRARPTGGYEIHTEKGWRP